MAGILIQLDNVDVATINLSKMNVVDISAYGALDKNPKASFSASGGNYAEGECGHLIWICDHLLLPGEVLSVKLIETCEISNQGKTVQELFPNDERSIKTDFSINMERAAEIRALPRLHDEFTVQIGTSKGERVLAMSNEHNTNFCFGVLWDFTRPAKARVRLTTNCLDDVLASRTGTTHLDATLSFGDTASFILVH